MVVNTYLFILLAIRNLASGGSHFHQQSMRWKGQGGKKKIEEIYFYGSYKFHEIHVI